MKDSHKTMTELINAVGDLYVIVDALYRRQSFVDPQLTDRMNAVRTACDEAHKSLTRAKAYERS